ncbi:MULTISPECIES: glycosyltransferase family 2 protein [unclassified Coleofasciculus]|uniref:glycosyltransferase family 2 protein n=1 Tax=unclassified Coleofasciculus TaxID=2692782 RepID=UPI0018815EBB|nr:MULTISPECIES: glycosyltransferase family 2 protein [unclassified Coleofasciculus]MBE9125341.1 glycosyltransferase family 2 protein [Coleofasciculus sp. LEGE 07081]MBE9148544.1 glycosyltransferase family 2 protein [Coleofasciculus sp. LEGE 07092]
MADWQIKTPVVFIIFKRPDTTEKVFEVIRQAKPPKLLVIADGARADRAGEAEKCAATRAIIERVDWDCEVLKNYSDVNMGCKQRLSSGLNWVFNTVEEAIILEDDCLPHPSFFRFCEELLDKYRNDKRIMMISGSNILGEWKSDIQSYHFAYYGSIWGWASWQRAWHYYDVNMNLWSSAEARNRVRDVICDKKQYLNRSDIFEKTYLGEIDTWDYQWGFARFLQSGLSIIPSGNLISNLGFTKEGTNTKKDTKGVANLPISSISFPLKEPYGVAVDRNYDYLRYQKTWKQSLLQRIRRKIKKIMTAS